MKRWMLVFLGILLIFCTKANAEITIIGSDMNSNAIGDEIDVDGMLTLAVRDARTEASWKSFQEDSRNQYVIVPLYVMNLSFEDVNISNTVSLKLTYKDYSFDPVDMGADDSIDSIVGQWRCYETDFSGKTTTEFDVIIHSITEDGRVDMQWGDYTPSGARWNEDLQGLILDSTQSLKYANGVLGGGGDRWRSVLFRATAGSGNADSNVLGMLEESTFNYVFKIPNAVIRNLKDCYLDINIGDKEYTIGF